MSDNINGKDYGDYFKALEQRLSEDADSAKSNAAKQKNKPKNKRYKVIRIKRSVVISVFAVLIGLVVLIAAIPSIKGNDKDSNPQNGIASDVEKTTSKKDNEPKITYNFSSNTADIPADNDAQSAIIVNTKTGDVIASRNPEERMNPASITKIMTLLVACESIKNYEDTFTMTLDITDPLFIEEASVAGFLNGEVISMTDLLYGLVLPSGADAAMGLAISVAGSEEEFAKLMNKKANELGLENTHFVNVSGLYHKNHYTTAYDMAVLLGAALKNPTCKKILSTYQYTTKKTPQHPDGIPLSATLFEYMYGTEPETATILGGKTGFVNEAGYCIASYGKSNSSENEYIIVTLKNSSRWPAFHGQIDLYKKFAK